MRTNDVNQCGNSLGRNFTSTCRASCRKLIAQVQRARTAIVSEFRGSFGAPEQLLKLAVNEAEALAWQTEYPYLLFPELAMEKAQAVANWQTRQRSIRQGHAAYAFAA